MITVGNHGLISPLEAVILNVLGDGSDSKWRHRSIVYSDIPGMDKEC